MRKRLVHRRYVRPCCDVAIEGLDPPTVYAYGAGLKADEATSEDILKLGDSKDYSYYLSNLT